MSVQSDVHQFLATIAKGANGDFIPMDPGKVAEQVGTTRNKVNKTLFNLTQTEKIELQRAKNGRTIIGFKLIAEPGPARRTRVKTVPARERLPYPVVVEPDAPRRRRSIPTPHLDEYEAAKGKYERLTSELGDLVSAEFRTNPYAEEALLLRDRLQRVEENYGPLVAEKEAMERDLRALRGRVNRELAESVARTEQAN